MPEETGEQKCECGMPLNNDTRCSCNPALCIHCCSCDSDCQCGCQKKSKE
ncbi:MAG: hypothetical protein HY764_04220 [Candidatus Portnoybacteria bacterium]|nr:hypothetical protein [Candidatus Portnoybacteria bacterium]